MPKTATPNFGVFYYKAQENKLILKLTWRKLTITMCRKFTKEKINDFLKMNLHVQKIVLKISLWNHPVIQTHPNLLWAFSLWSIGPHSRFFIQGRKISISSWLKHCYFFSVIFNNNGINLCLINRTSFQIWKFNISTKQRVVNVLNDSPLQHCGSLQI